MKRSRGPEEDGSSYDEQGAAVASAPKIVTTDPENLDDAQAAVVTLQCSLPGHAPVSFTRYDDYEQHYNNAHTNRCLDCRKNFPSPHVLDLHIRELHDALTEIKREKGENVVSSDAMPADMRQKQMTNAFVPSTLASSRVARTISRH